ncbi:hypothetical protein M527_04830 [Sphingobium indicum IP26]|uniref:hypothetical protein n=1 Tax=Sphingobium indicum TaxID=332055 RepID=UPI000376E1E1|nr:hypothetical protein M527_02945 [Sphingobium indicum IP26]EPR11413.1 hypothetical protein M527_04830 [Sphingobium indicum IP26]
MRLLVWGTVGLIGIASVSALLAQTVEGLDVEAVKRRSADLQAEAQAFVDQVKDRGAAFREDAAVVREEGMRNMRQVRSRARHHAGLLPFGACARHRAVLAVSGQRAGGDHRHP